MSRELAPHELRILKTIAEILNRGNDLHPMLDEVLAKLLELTGLETGWIFLIGEEPEYECAAASRLPPALARGEGAPMREGVCWCLGSYWDGKLRQATNIIECKRLEDAVELGWGDTRGITHHATVPLMAGGTRFGLLNVAAPGKERFSDEELALLQAVAFQIGTAVERVRLYQAARRRAEAFARLGEVSRRLGAVLAADRLPVEVARQVAAAFGWPVVALFLCEGADVSLRAVHAGGATQAVWRRYARARAGPAGRALERQEVVRVADAEAEPELRARPGWPPYLSAVAVPLRVHGDPVGVLLVGSDRRRAFDAVDVEVLKALAAHASLAIENARLYAQRRDLARAEERNRLARDLHDSVSQTLFSIALTARAARDLVGERPEEAGAALDRVLELAQAAQREMRALIWQLRPAGLEEGLLTALKRYAESLGLAATAHLEGVCDLPAPIEEALWRIGQEALNNVRKHAVTDRVEIRLLLAEAGATLEVTDAGRGFTPGRAGQGSLGLVSMRERAEALGGTLAVDSRRGKGTRVRAWIPVPVRPGER